MKREREKAMQGEGRRMHLGRKPWWRGRGEERGGGGERSRMRMVTEWKEAGHKNLSEERKCGRDRGGACEESGGAKRRG